MLEIDIFRILSQNELVILRGDVWGFGCPNDSPKVLGVSRGDSLECGCPNDTKTPCWLRL